MAGQVSPIASELPLRGSENLGAVLIEGIVSIHTQTKETKSQDLYL